MHVSTHCANRSTVQLNHDEQTRPGDHDYCSELRVGPGRAVALVKARRQRSQPGPTLLGLPVDGVYSIWCDEDDDHPALVRDLHRDDEEE